MEDDSRPGNDPQEERESSATPSALSGLTVIDLSESIGGQYCARLLADFGADVTLVEPLGGSRIRALPPFSARDAPGESLLFFHLNMGKRSVAIDHETAEGRAALRGLLRSADVAILPAGLGVDFSTDLDPACIAAIVSPFGSDGPLAHWKGPE